MSMIYGSIYIFTYIEDTIDIEGYNNDVYDL